jgi:hypothetical protein
MAHLARELARRLEQLAIDLGPALVAGVVHGRSGETIDLCICDDDHAVEERSRLLLDVYAGEARSVMFVSLRAGPAVVRDGERARARRIHAHGLQVGLPVHDWFIVGDDGSYQSLQSATGANVPPDRQ